ncbi:hypothetical protein B0I35DRAFT_384031 [Stachybotrys elegans]|uniref:Uncharacterized protein n=1 Tax=Stachybotrys elegans TaxID=80388 RepID=A0A8K0SDQ9_9HYPO|nr:hypothetical protein B0I35DRAFT_384031 [Stachybotrys elegans]
MDNDSSEFPVYTGVWTNWSQRGAFRSTLTLSRQDGALLIAFLAFFVTLVGAQAWRIVCFVFFHFHSTSLKQDALYHQRQAVVRNSASPIGGVLSLARIMYAWKTSPESRKKAFRRILPLLLLSIVMAAALAVASGLSSQVALGTEVLIRSDECGIVDLAAMLTNETASINATALLSPMVARRAEVAADYAQRCYESNSSDCLTFFKKALPMHITTNASCPFDDNLCLSQDSNIMIDTGLMDSVEDLGLNNPPESRFQMQYTLQCAPLATDGWKSNYTYNGKLYTSYQYGVTVGDYTDCNCTVAVEADTDHDIDTPFYTQAAEYSLNAIDAPFSKGEPVHGSSMFYPVPGLTGHGGDLVVVVLFPQSMTFSGPSRDIWYKATTPAHTWLGALSEDMNIVDVYAADEPVWPMGCVEKYQMCKRGVCTGLGSNIDTVQAIVEDLDAASDFIGDSSYLNWKEGLSNLLNSLSRKSLASRFKTWGSLQAPLEPNEWHKDVIHWFATQLSGLQLRLVQVPSGTLTDDPTLNQWMTGPSPDERQDYCNSQKIYSPNHISFSFLGILIIVVGGGLIMIVSVTIEPTTAFLKRKLRPKSSRYAQLEWRGTETLHLQRLAHEEVEWMLGSWDIPITTPGTKLTSMTEDSSRLPCLDRTGETCTVETQSQDNSMDTSLVEQVIEEVPTRSDTDESSNTIVERGNPLQVTD